MKRKVKLASLPLDLEGKEIEIDDIPDICKMKLLAESRCKRFLFHAAIGALTLPDVVAAAYIQGMSDCVRLTNR